jgi:hypothetical protein
MFQELLLADFVVADLTLDNANVWYEIGVRHALRSGGAVLLYALRDRLPFDIAGQRTQRYTIGPDGKLDANRVNEERAGITEAITATLEAWRHRKVSPVYAQLEYLKEPDWKTLRVGGANEHWERLEAWHSKVKRAQRKLRAADIVVLADEVPSRVLQLEALTAAGKALNNLGKPYFAEKVLERAEAIAPDDLMVQQQLALAIGRQENRWAEAAQRLTDLAARHSDGETGGLLGRSYKDRWTSRWRIEGRPAAERQGLARESVAALRESVAGYTRAFRANPHESYPGINTVTMDYLHTHLTGAPVNNDLPLLVSGVRWAVDCELRKERGYWGLVTRAELHLVADDDAACLRDYEDATALADYEGKVFDLDSTRQQLDMLAKLGFRPELVAKAASIIKAAEQRLGGVEPEPTRVVLFSGHMIDKPGRNPPRFPATKVAAAQIATREELDRVEVEPGDLAICGAACGGDLIFAEACLERGMRVELRLPQDEPAFLRDSVRFAEGDWENRYHHVRERSTLLVCPKELGPPPAGVAIYERNNLWMLYAAMARGLHKVSFIALLDTSSVAEGPGGTAHMRQVFEELTARPMRRIDPAALAE